MLKVPTDATPSEIKRAYYKEALKVHPDKNRDDTRAANRFEELSTAYQVLVRDETRDSYDNFGKCYLKQQEQETPFLDAHVFFDVMFGSRLVEPYVGELQIASLVDDFLSLTDVQSIRKKSTYVENGTRQKRRVLDIALHLRKSIAKFVDGQLSEETFRLSCRGEAVAIANGDLGDEFLISIGRSLLTPAKNFIANRKNLWEGTARSVATTTDNLMQTYQTASAFLQSMTSVFWPLMNAFSQQKSAADEDDDDDGADGYDDAYLMNDEFGGFGSAFGGGSSRKGEAGSKSKGQQQQTNPDSCSAEADKFQVDTLKLMKDLEKSIPKAFRLVRQLNDRDINHTLKAACNKVIADAGNIEMSLRRAYGLQVLGEVFYEMGTQFHREDRWKDDAYMKQIIKKAYSTASVHVMVEEFYDE